MFLFVSVLNHMIVTALYLLRENTKDSNLD